MIDSIEGPVNSLTTQRDSPPCLLSSLSFLSESAPWRSEKLVSRGCAHVQPSCSAVRLSARLSSPGTDRANSEASPTCRDHSPCRSRLHECVQVHWHMGARALWQEEQVHGGHRLPGHTFRPSSGAPTVHMLDTVPMLCSTVVTVCVSRNAVASSPVSPV